MTIALLTFNDDDAQILQLLCAGLPGDKKEVKADSFDAKDFTHVLALSSMESKILLAKLGARLDVQPITDVVHIVDENTFIRPIYAGNALQTVKSKDAIKLISLRAGASPNRNASRDLGKADVVVGGGRAFGKDGFPLVHELAEALHGAAGATRAAVDAGYIGNDAQIGQTGKTIAPRLYIACAISGAIQHVGGIRGAKTVIAINSDANAPIFKHATYGYVGDVFDVVPALIQRFKST